MEDNCVISRVVNGDVNSFRSIVERYQDRIYNLCKGFVHNQQDAEDITQEIFTSAFVSLGTFQGKSSFATWLYRIALNSCYTFLRNKKRSSIIQFYESLISNTIEIIPITPKSEQPDSILNKKQTNEHVLKAIDNLAKNQRTAFILSKYENLSQKEIAEVMNISETAVESLLQRAKKSLQPKLKKFYEVEFKPTDLFLLND